MRAPFVRSTSRAWPDADALFHSDPRWIGSDDASSIELSPGRVLWLFGDTFVGARAGASRDGAAFPRNSLAIQRGTDPARPNMSFHWGADADGTATSFFAAPDGAWYWPLHGARVGTEVVLFMMLVRSPQPELDPIQAWRELGSLGFFRVDGWAAIAVENPDDDPDAWRMRTIAVREQMPVVGAACLVEDDMLLAYAWDDAKRVTLARWRLGAFANPELTQPEWWHADGWSRAPGDSIIDDGATEFSVHRDAETGRYIQIQTAFRARGIGLREAPAPHGPWSALDVVHVTEEAARDELIVYAAKAHPELDGDDLVVTYASNAEVDVCLADQSIYYPRFVRIAWEHG